MVITIDVGNSNVVVVVYDNQGEIVYQLRDETVKNGSFEMFKQYLKRVQVALPSACQAVVLASVVPSITKHMKAAVVEVFDMPPLCVNVQNVPELKIHLDNPSELGADFIASAYGAIAKKMVPAIIADMGSATKLSVVGEDYQFLGGVIIPGIGISSAALVQFIPHLPAIELQLPQNIIGHDTISSMQSGLLYGVIGSIEGIARRIELQLKQPHYKILTGGYANIVHAQTEGFVFEPNLVNDGLYYLYKEKKVNYEC